jgi:hypothetical protein
MTDAKRTERTSNSPTNRYYIQDSRTYVGNCCLWWRPKSSGYTTNLNDAGIYPLAETRHRETDIAWAVEDVDAVAMRTVEIQILRRP